MVQCFVIFEDHEEISQSQKYRGRQIKGLESARQWRIRRLTRKAKDSPDHLICLKEERRGDRQAQHLGGLEVDGQLKPCRLLHGHYAGFFHIACTLLTLWRVLK